MLSKHKSTLLRWLRIPAAPHIPPGEEAHCTVFNAGKGYLTYLRLRWVVIQLGALIGLLFVVFALHQQSAVLAKAAAKHGDKWTYWLDVAELGIMALKAMGVAGYFFVAILNFFLLRIDFECRYYLLTDRSLRIQEGLWSFHEQTFTLANIQNIDLRQNPLQRILGIADVVVQTAGGGNMNAAAQFGKQHGQTHIGFLRGVADAEAIRDHLLARLKAYRDAGLGDEPARMTTAAAGPAAESAAIEALRKQLVATRAEVAALRQLLAPSPPPQAAGAD